MAQDDSYGIGGTKKQSRFADLISERAKGMRASEIRELLKLTQRPEIISFAGGLPNPKAFPVDKVQEITADLLKDQAGSILQYGTTEGHRPLREELVKWMKTKGVDLEIDNIMITHGSQQGLDLISKVFLDPHDVIVVGEPTYLGGTATYNAFQAKMESVPLDEKGIMINKLREKLHMLHRHGQNPKFLYIIPNFQNPTGVTIPKSKRNEILELAEDYDLLILEDNPYGELRYKGEHIPPCLSSDTNGRVIYFGTFSKILAPGFRIAWTCADKEIIQKLVIAKQATDLCTNTFGQAVAGEYMARGYLAEHIGNIKDLYSRKQEIMLEALDNHFTMDEVSWTKPEGGMFIWVTLPEYMSTRRMFKYALKHNVAYVTGSPFFPNGGGDNCMRLNFTHPTDENITKGIELLAGVIESEMDRQKEEPMIDFETPVAL